MMMMMIVTLYKETTPSMVMLSMTTRFLRLCLVIDKHIKERQLLLMNMGTN